MTSSIARRVAPAILIAMAAFGAVAGVSMEAAGDASARPNQCADGQCPPPHCRLPGERDHFRAGFAMRMGPPACH
jgi:hypothetical protein